MSNEMAYAVTIHVSGVMPSKFLEEANSVLANNDRVEIIRANDNLNLIAIWEEDANKAIQLLLNKLNTKFTFSNPRVLFKVENDNVFEPIMKLCVTITEEYMGDVVGDLNRRRGLILEMKREEDYKVTVVSNIPLSELFGYTVELNELTFNSGIVSVDFEKYQTAPNLGGPGPNEPVSMAIRA